MSPDPNINDELTRRHRTTVSVVIALLATTLLLIALAFVFAPRMSIESSGGESSIEKILRVLVVLIGVSAVGLRRFSFAPRRLQDIAILKGASGLLATLQRTTLIVATLGSDIAVIGFIIALLTGEPFNMILLGLAALAVILYAYPRRAAWQQIIETMQTENELAVNANRTAKGTIA